jgi:hypothetical protein
MKEVGLVLGVGESRVSQIHSVALVRLRARLEDILRSHLRIAAFPASQVSSQGAAVWKTS